MMMKTFSMTVGILVALTVWFAALTMALFLAVLGMHVLVIGGLTVYHLLH